MPTGDSEYQLYLTLFIYFNYLLAASKFIFINFNLCKNLVHYDDTIYFV